MEKAVGACYGGLARLQTALTTARRAAANPLVLNAGDFFQAAII